MPQADQGAPAPAMPPPARADRARDRVRVPGPEVSNTRAMSAQALAFAPGTYDPVTGEVDVVWSTGAAVRRYDWWDEVYFDEILDLKGADLARLNAGAPLLLDHEREFEAVVGSVVPGSARLEKGAGVCRVRFDRTSAEGQAAENKVAGGHLRFVSVGYSVPADAWEKQGAPDGQPAAWVARQWTPFEVSLVPVPADAGAAMRNAPGGAPSAHLSSNRPTQAARGSTMPHENDPNAAAPNAMPAAPAPNADMGGARAAASPATPAAPVVDVAALRAAAVTAERARIATINDRCRALGLGDDLARAMIAEGVEGDAMNARLVDALAARSAAAPATPRVEVGTSHEDPGAVRAAMAEALAVRYMPAFKPTNDRHRDFAGWRARDFAGETLRLRGERVPRNPSELAERAFATTSDFPLLLSAAANKMLLAGYALYQPTFRGFMAKKSFNDFKAHNFLRAGDFPSLLQNGEDGEIKVGTLSENRETAILSTYGRRIRVTRQVLVNDDLSAFGDWSGMIGRRVSDFENATAMALVASNSGAGPNLSDAAAVFSTAHKNKSSSNTAITVAALGLGRQAVREQKSLDGLVLNLAPTVLLCGTAKQTEAEMMLASITPTANSAVNPFSGKLGVLSDANLSGNGWYLFADPGVAPVYIYGFLDGAEGPRVTTGPVQGFDAIEVQVLLDFGVAAIDYRGGYFNAGA